MSTAPGIVLRYARAGILVDSNLLLLFFVGGYDPRRIATFKRTAKYEIADYQILLSFLRGFQRLLTTPHVLTELSNLAGQLGEPSRSEFFKDLVKMVPTLEEHSLPSAEAVRGPAFIRFGLTDSAIVSLSRGAFPVLTDDLALAGYLATEGVDVVNFHHLRLIGREA